MSEAPEDGEVCAPPSGANTRTTPPFQEMGRPTHDAPAGTDTRRVPPHSWQMRGRINVAAILEELVGSRSLLLQEALTPEAGTRKPASSPARPPARLADRVDGGSHAPQRRAFGLRSHHG